VLIFGFLDGILKLHKESFSIMTGQNQSFGRAGILTLGLALSTLLGCDKISSWYEGITHKSGHQETTAAPSGSATTSPVAAPTAAPAPTELPKDIIAQVGTWSITVDDFNERLNKLKEILPEFNPTSASAKKLILEELIRQQLLVKEAEDTGLAQKKDVVDTVEDFRKTLLVQELATTLTKDIQATEADAQEYYNKNTKEFVTKAEWRIREIVVPDEGQAKEILVQLLQGADFAETAKTRSKASSADKGGDKGFLDKFPFEQMQTAAASLEAGKISNVFKGPDGYYIVKLEEKKGGAPKGFAAVKDELVKGLTLRKQQEAVLEHLNKLAGKTQIQINEDLLK
jgi:peptidyl-prolyl cis-trans isomerase C